MFGDDPWMRARRLSVVRRRRKSRGLATQGDFGDAGDLGDTKQRCRCAAEQVAAMNQAARGVEPVHLALPDADAPRRNGCRPAAVEHTAGSAAL
jgi:hypothetical protein